MQKHCNTHIQSWYSPSDVLAQTLLSSLCFCSSYHHRSTHATNPRPHLRYNRPNRMTRKFDDGFCNVCHAIADNRMHSLAVSQASNHVRRPVCSLETERVVCSAYSRMFWFRQDDDVCIERIARMDNFVNDCAYRSIASNLTQIEGKVVVGLCGSTEW